MPTYVTLVNWTDQGVKTAKDTVKRAREFRTLVEQRGGKLSSIYWTQGRFDIVTTIDAPDEQTVMTLLLTLGGLGNVRTETLRAFNESEVEGILQKM